MTLALPRPRLGSFQRLREPPGFNPRRAAGAPRAGFLLPTKPGRRGRGAYEWIDAAWRSLPGFIQKSARLGRGGVAAACRSAGTAPSPGACAEPAWAPTPGGALLTAPVILEGLILAPRRALSPLSRGGGHALTAASLSLRLNFCGAVRAWPLLPGGFVLPGVKIAIWGGWWGS